jgi:hypothetical protein
MRNKLFKSTFSVLIPGVILAATSHFKRPAMADSPTPLPPQNPLVSRFNEDITFYASFDGYATADLSVGNGTPQNYSDTAKWSDGYWNKALVGLAKPLQYQAINNIDLTSPGGIVVWISPQNWTHQEKPGYIDFIYIHSQGITLQISRMGNIVNREKLYAWFNPNGKGVIDSVGSTLKWDSGWHLLAANWGNGFIEFSLDGNSFHREATPKPEPYSGKDPGIINVGGGADGSYPYLMDELCIFNRPLTNDEVQWVYQSTKK